jgi:phosphoglycerate dehydrogenase-like enzyme
LDVFAQEPLDPASELWLTPGLAVTPHIAGAPDETTLVDLFVENLRRYVEGEQLLNVVDLSRGY